MKMCKVYENDNDNDDDGQRTNFDQKSSLEPLAQVSQKWKLNFLLWLIQIGEIVTYSDDFRIRLYILGIILMMRLRSLDFVIVLNIIYMN